MEETKPSTQEIMRVIDDHERYRNAYFWKPSPDASLREKNGFERTYEWIEDGKHYQIEQTYHESTKRCHYRICVTVDGTKKDIRALKKLVGNR
ncbi:hypothetical protein KO465_04395 [Candidatus Micrarchaeota archaeon]|jgi:hypothetical protein|nr:hypothetical protein [Candidatus Micrarchaeota archaeon]